ncbi:hypothetical protein COCSADRAFT_230134 [Bipolaris sorokiniana ND90Pr]|uniref:Uncharacterized protein n=1 Tax=Cochliobolus sativus (strain ND90Pr / ATCC 201652) TaxID=665912 RepID=M2SWW6_COCSN|nr:uncharacterized protein COCSADRAFT_230134 [Bipolaris sorokiniana ND90Pr]EMD61327.1 hypothetical protein COCSADRAFT_230134 [Bipolaris sorokiniana ND90Pr]
MTTSTNPTSMQASPSPPPPPHRYDRQIQSPPSNDTSHPPKLPANAVPHPSRSGRLAPERERAGLTKQYLAPTIAASRAPDRCRQSRSS